VALLLPAVLLMCACTQTAEVGGGSSIPDSLSSRATTAAEAEQTAPLVDAAIPYAAAGQAGWEYHQEAVVDLDGDAAPERLVVIANASMHDGQPSWDDAHIWQVYIQEPGGERTYIFSRWVQLGPLDVRLTRADGTRSPTILIVERGPHLLGAYEIRYGGPADAHVVQRVQWGTDPSPWNRGPEE
jgi:hypothetical protein